MNDRSHEQVNDRSQTRSDSLRTSEAIVSRYFALLNQAQFQEVAQLFAIEGVLCAPFADSIVGREAIAAYLEAEAREMKSQPLRQSFARLPDGQIQAEVVGQVQTSLFGVNVGWTFLLSAQGEINLVRVNLLASLQELFQLRPEVG